MVVIDVAPAVPSPAPPAFVNVPSALIVNCWSSPALFSMTYRYFPSLDTLRATGSPGAEKVPVIGVSAPVKGSMLYAEIVLSPLFATYKYLPRDSEGRWD